MANRTRESARREANWMEKHVQKKIALLDRDGTMIVDKVYLSDPDEIEFPSGALEGMRLLRDEGFTLVLVTNQSGIARGFFDEETLERIHRRLRQMLAEQQIDIAAIYHCPHGPDEGCDCRKPSPGMVKTAMRDLDFGPDQAVMIGDSDADMGLAKAVGVPGVRIGAGQGCARDFLEAAALACAMLKTD